MSTIEKIKAGRWVATTEIKGQTKTSPPLKTRKEAEGWIEGQAFDAKAGNDGQRLMFAAIVKGLIEKKDGTAYFGSTMAYRYHFECAVEFGYVKSYGEPTDMGYEWYERCLKQLSPRRQVNWRAEGGVGLPNIELKE